MIQKHILDLIFLINHSILVFIKKGVLQIFILSIISCAKYPIETQIGNNLILYIAGIRVIQLADIPYSLTTIISNERGAADLDGVGENASFVKLSSLKYYNDKLYLLDNTRNIYPKLKSLDLNTKEIRTIGSINTDSKPIIDMEIGPDGIFFLTNDKTYYYSTINDISTGVPTQIINFVLQTNNFSFTKIKYDTIRKKVYLLNRCNIYSFSYQSILQSPIILTSPLFSFPGCTDTEFNSQIDNLGFDYNDNIYVCQKNSLYKVSPSGVMETIYSNDAPQSYTKLNCHSYKNNIYFMGFNRFFGVFTDPFPKNRLYKINTTNLKVSLLAGGGNSSSGNSFDGIGTYSGIRNILYMDFDSSENIYFIENSSDYNSMSQLLIQKIRRATKN